MTEKKTKTKDQIVKETIADVIISFLAVIVIFIFAYQVSNPVMVLLGAFTAQLPDWLEVPHTLLGSKFPLFVYNYKAQSWIHHVGFDSRLKAPWGIITQVIIVLIFLLWAAPAKF